MNGSLILNLNMNIIAIFLIIFALRSKELEAQYEGMECHSRK